jgi:hypothetical protein
MIPKLTPKLIQAAVITFALYLLMVISSQQASSLPKVLSNWFSAYQPSEVPWEN